MIDGIMLFDVPHQLSEREFMGSGAIKYM